MGGQAGNRDQLNNFEPLERFERLELFELVGIRLWTAFANPVD